MPLLREIHPRVSRPATHVPKNTQAPEALTLPASLDSLKLYQQQIPRQRLDPAQLKSLARCIAEARENTMPNRQTLEVMSLRTRFAQEAKQQLIEMNLRLVLLVVGHYRGLGVDVMDLIQEGNLGLMHAVEKYDYRRGVAFSTYAIWWIRHYISRAIFEQASGIALPLYKIEEIKRVERVRRTLQQQFSVEPTLDDLARAVGVSVEEVIALLATPHDVVSIDQPQRGGSEEATLRETLADERASTPEQIVESAFFGEHMRAALEHLPPMERRVIELRYGIDEHGFTQKELSLVEIGKQLGRSHEAIRQAEGRALQKLAALCEHLRVYLEI